MRANFINSHITQLAIHIVGNKIADDGIVLSKSCLSISDHLADVLSNFFLGAFSFDEYFHLYHDTDLNLNEVFYYVSAIFNDPKSFYEESLNLAKHLYNQSLFPNIKEGEFYIALFKGVEFDNQVVDAVGLFKTEKKSTFLKTSVHDGNVNIDEDKGVDIKRLDKGCLIFDVEKDNGFVVTVVDNTNKGNLARYWVDDFLQICQINDTYTNTNNLMSLTKSFITQELPKANSISKNEQIGMLNKALRYFKDHKTFELDDFTEEVIVKSEFVEKFHHFKSDFETSKDFIIDSEFLLSESAIKKQQRSYRRAINLDKKIQIIINGNSNCIEKGTDCRGKYYKIYYNNEE